MVTCKLKDTLEYAHRQTYSWIIKSALIPFPNPANMRAKNKIIVKIEENPEIFFNKNLLQPTFAIPDTRFH